VINHLIKGKISPVKVHPEKNKSIASGLGSNARTDHLNLISNPFSGGEKNG